MDSFSGLFPQKAVSVDSIDFIRYFELDDDFDDMPEKHEAWEMIYMDRGDCNIIANNEVIPLHQGEIYFHPPMEEHMLKMIHGNSPNVFIICFRSKSVAMHYIKQQVISASLSTKQHIAAIIHEASNTFELPFNDPKMCKLDFKDENALWAGDQSIAIRMELMFIELIRKNFASIKKDMPKMASPKDIVTDEVCQKVIEYMQTRLFIKTSLEDISEAISTSKAFLSNHFNEKMGCSVMYYFNKMKIDCAKQYIKENRYNFTQISEKLLFTNVHYFSTVFKKFTNMTPSEYKNSYKSKVD